MLTIRPINFRKELPAILKLERAIFAKDAFPVFEFIFLYSKGKETFLVAYHGKQLVGYISVYLEGRVGYMASIAVDIKFRRQGIARQLIQAIIDILQSNQHISSLELHVRQSNQAAIAFYQSMGFTLAFVELAYYEDEDALVMSLSLAT